MVWFGLVCWIVLLHGIEYGFGPHAHSIMGIFEVEPKQCPGFTFQKSILIGRTDLGPREIRAFMEKLVEEYSGNTYHLITKNCNHFCNDVSQANKESDPSLGQSYCSIGSGFSLKVAYLRIRLWC